MALAGRVRSLSRAHPISHPVDSHETPGRRALDNLPSWLHLSFPALLLRPHAPRARTPSRPHGSPGHAAAPSFAHLPFPDPCPSHRFLS
ncbi:hypothetical protein FJTKL_09968 [Diaporthe vaccinii]|uniref:Uncharacterized protein n=1 Tax=Diaporthe vaccinii TaxID=105482 RepID=A0ABR4ELP9_9PEZI